MSQIIYIAYGSESGNAENLAITLHNKLNTKFANHKIYLSTLDEISLSSLGNSDVLLVITSSFGDGEPPANASVFHEQLLEAENIACQYAVFGLGDVSYPKFCGFSIEVDALLAEKGAITLAKRVDADNHYQPFFEIWTLALQAYFSGNPDELKYLSLQVKAYDENQGFTGTVYNNKRINTGDFPVYNTVIDIAGSGINYQAGDLLYLLPPVNQNTLARIEAFYGQLSKVEKEALSNKELRLLGKPLLRAVAKHTKNADLKKLTKVSASDELAEYIYGRDVADLLQDFCTPQSLNISDLLNILSAQLPRAYSIASSGSANLSAKPDTVRLCVREVSYKQNGTIYHGTGSHFLANAQQGDNVVVFVRDNPHFHLPKNPNAPIIMIGAGTGIAPYLGFLEASHKGEMYLFFGERRREHDFLYEDELKQYLEDGKLTVLYTAFSRDQNEKIYVQDCLKQQGKKVWALIQNQAEIYLCGSKANLGKAIDTVLCDIAQTYGGLDEVQAKQWLYEMVTSQRYHQDLY